MENPITELEMVVRSVTQERSTPKVMANIDKYFTEDVMLQYPLFNQIESRHGRENFKAAYQVTRSLGHTKDLFFHAIMVNKEQTQATLDLTQVYRIRILPFETFDIRCQFIVRLTLRKSARDNKYRISLQQDNFPTDITQAGGLVPRIICIANDVIKALAWLYVIILGRIFMMLDFS